MNSNHAKVSVVIPCSLSDYPYLLSWLIGYLAYDHDHLHYIVVLNGIAGKKQLSLHYSDKITYIQLDAHCSPGVARNLAISTIQSGYVAFLDARTVPTTKWAEYIQQVSCLEKPTSYIGSVIYIPTKPWHYPLLLTTYGLRPVHSLPGSIFHFTSLQSNGYFLPRFRAGEDIDWLWRARIRGLLSPGTTPSLTYDIQTNATLTYFIRKWHRNYSHSSLIPYVSQQQRIYYLLFLFLTINTLASLWNGSVASWDTLSPLYIPYVSRLTFIVSSALYAVFRCLYLPIRKGASFPRTLMLLPLVLPLSLMFDIVKLVAFFPALIGFKTIND